MYVVETMGLLSFQELTRSNNAGINLTGYHPPGHPGAFAPKCVPSLMAFAQQKMRGGRANKLRCPWGLAFAST